AEGEDVAWPEEIEASAYQENQVETAHESEPVPATPSALELLASTAQRPAISPVPPVPSMPVTPMPQMAGALGETSEPPATNEREHLPAFASPRNSVPIPLTDVFVKVYSDMRGEAQALEVQAASLAEMLNQLYSAVSLIEGQRTEFRGFLDGSKDALDRMEEWAGQAMGLNLRNSPEQVRRYLPLSVMWVANTKLKKVFDLLTGITSDVEMTDGQISTALKQLQTSITSCGEVFEQLAARDTVTPLQQEPGWSPWEMQIARDAEAMRESVTFERRGDPIALRSEIEAKFRDEFQRAETALREKLRREEARLREDFLREQAQIREEIRHEYEERPLTLAARHELEQQIRDEVRQEFEANRQLQENVTGLANTTPSLQEITDQLRSEIEIQVRQEFLSQINAGRVDGESPSLMPPAAAVPRTSNFLDQARQASGLPALTTPSQQSVPAPLPAQQPKPIVAQTPVLPPSPPPITQVQAPSSAQTSAFSGEFGEEAAEIFRLEAEEHLQTISMHMAALEKDPMNRDLIQGIRRATHTLKGAAGMMGFRPIADLSHVSEDLLDSIMEGSIATSPPVLGLILDTAEGLDQLINGNGTPAEDEAKVQALRLRYVELLGEQNISIPSLEDEIDVDIDPNDDLMLQGTAASNQAVETNAQRAARGDLSVRVRLQKLDELVNLFGEMLVNRSVLEERIERLVRLVGEVSISSTRLSDVGQKLESRFEAATLPSGHSVQVMPGEGNKSGFSANGTRSNRDRIEPEHFADFDELELDRYTEFHQLARGLSETVSDMTTLSAEMDAVIRECEGVFARESRLSTTLQDRLMNARLVPLSTMAPRLYRAARSVALKQHKEFEFLLAGEETEVDRTVYEEIAGPLLHLMRNAVNHAIETPQVRLERGKQSVGQIKLSASYEANQIAITVRDDGNGIDPDHVRNKAIEQGLIRPNQALSDNDVIDLLFRPGFSTAEVLSEESGRGVGLDVVRDSVSRLRGTLEVESMPGQGTAFTMKFPTSLAIQSALMVNVSGQQYAVPTVMIETIGRMDNFKSTMAGGQPAILVRNDAYPLIMLSQLLALPVRPLDEKAQLLLINTGGHRVALVIDEIKGKLDIVVKNLGPHLRNVHGVAGGTVLGNGRVVLILELNELLSSHLKAMNSSFGSANAPALREGFVISTPALQSIARPVDGASVSQPLSSIIQVPAGSGRVQAPTPEQGKHVLIVDDSPSVRRVVSNMLKQHGWEVQMARDGVEALEMISQQTPAAVLLDIEMPRMDGFELIATVRAQEQYRTLPMVVLTSRAAVKHQQRATQLGASGYVVKPYQDEELLSILNSLVYGTTTTW
ncbi:MAG: response regulator, partial [Chloroflexota bacterium]|nr:response regulator [Chloroflexota bacterium]